MDKKTFMKELEQALSVLQEEELNDIISEYEQHIDMKQERGLTEEEAIADFGSLDELTAEILEAYHVRADYAAKKGRGQGQLPEEKKGRQGWMRVVGIWWWALLKAGAQGLGHFLSGIGRLWKHLGQGPVKQAASWQEEQRFPGSVPKENAGMSENQQAAGEMAGEEQSKGPGSQKKTGEVSGQRGILPLKNVQRTMAKRGLGAAAGSFLGRSIRLAADMVQGCIRIALWGMRMTWNAMCIGFALGCGLFGLICLYGMGMLMVLLSQGYPLAGVTLGCVGLVMCSFSAACLGMTWLWRGQKSLESRGDRKDSRGEGWPGAKSRTAGEKELSKQPYQEMEGGQHA